MPKRPSTEYLDQANELLAATGEALLAWAQTEYQLGLLFRRLMRRATPACTAIWGTIVSFDAKMGVLQELARIEAVPWVREDLTLLFAHARRMHKLRNEVAHATLLNDENMTPVLVPFHTHGGAARARLHARDLRSRANRFVRTTEAFVWVLKAFKLSNQPLQAWLQQPADLVVELRASQSQQRKEQQERDLLLRQARKLQAEGKWPQA